ncbi:hypothetical protein FQA47_002542 [Oryzias melastigma]|uniref:Osteocrin n=1 Tax=Oryzias melastigma TaxID=30732 RepID=A0A834C5V6_ORYME|nr:hypothetical protein FQA47_002542 [Oryzias melastigma]
MHVCCPLLVTSLLSVLLSGSAGGFGIHAGPVQRHLEVMNPGAELTAHLIDMEHGVALKRKRSVPTNDSAPERVGARILEAKPGPTRQRKGAESPLRRVKAPPIDRIGMSGLPKRMGHASKQRRTRPLS